MKANVGLADRLIRVVLALIFFAAAALGWVTGVVAIVAVVLGVVFVATSVIKFCPLYLPFGLSTIRNKLN